MLRSLFKKEQKFYTWTNPDGSRGGDVSRFAHVDPTATVDRFAVVLSGSTVGPNRHVRPGDMVDGEHTIRFGPPLSAQRAKALKTPTPR